MCDPVVLLGDTLVERALHHTGTALGRHLFEDGVMYASSKPCPMCLVACY